MILLDATGSMSNLLSKVKHSVMKMFEDARVIMTQKVERKIDPKLVEIQFGCYRNYDCDEKTLFEHSTWESDPKNLV